MGFIGARPGTRGCSQRMPRCYIVAGLGARANGGRNTFPLVHTNNFDVALMKRISITERMRFDSEPRRSTCSTTHSGWVPVRCEPVHHEPDPAQLPGSEQPVLRTI